MLEPQEALASFSRTNNMSLPRPGDARSAQRKTAPSPLQVTQISTPTTDTFMHIPQELVSSHPPRGGSPPLRSPHSQYHGSVMSQDNPKSPRERLEDLLSTENMSGTTEAHQPYVAPLSKSSPLTTPKESSYRALRNVSAPIQSGVVGGGLPKQYPPEMASSMAKAQMDKAEPRFVPRTASIDSTMSSVSSTTSYSYGTQDPMSPNPGEIAQAIAAAGSAEAAVHFLLKEKKQAAAQNSQLWRLVNKQRTLVLGLNKDLDRALQDKEKYRKKLREYLAQQPLVPAGASEPLSQSPPPRSPSPADSDSPDELPIQRHSVREIVPSRVNDSHRSSVKTVEEIISPAALSSSANSIPLGSDGRQTPSQRQSLADPAQPPNMTAQHTGENYTENSHGRRPPKPLQPLEIHKEARSTPHEMSSPISPEIESTTSRGSFTARRSITTPRKSQQSPLTDITPVAEDFPVVSPSSRKAPPAPLNLFRPAPAPALMQAEKHSPEEHSDSEYEEVVEVDELPAFERGRRKTREDDDREREIAVIKEQESRSQSKKSKRSKSAAEKMVKDVPPPLRTMPKSPAIRSFSPDEPLSDMSRHLSPPASLVGVLSRPPSSTNSHPNSERSLLSPFPLSPGLPSSPRPVDRPVNSPPPRLPRDGPSKFLSSPPLSPRIGAPMPLSPRPPRREIPLPPHTPNSLVSPLPTHAENEQVAMEPPKSPMQSPREAQRSGNSAESGPSSPRPWTGTGPSSIASGGIYRGLVSDVYPDLLLPPNALPSILVTVTSSRLKPSRFSTITSKGTEEEPVFTLGVSARSNLQQLWRVEKATMSLPQLAQRIKQVSTFNVQLPDRSLFTGHAPAKIDARRRAIEKYFEAILDTPMNEKAALIVCQYLSTEVIQAEEHDASGAVGHPEAHSPVNVGVDGRLIKEGYLTKRGKNFGGWKARFFILDDPNLRYYESPGGPLLGTIKLTNAQIGRQSVQHSSNSPSRGLEDSDKEFRHAFLILEPKKNNSSSLVRHILCAESDEERDEWVEALLQYVGGALVEHEKSRSAITKTDSGSSKAPLVQAKKRSAAKEEGLTEGTETDASEGLQSVSYEDTAPAQAPVRVLINTSQTEPSSPGQILHNGNMAPPLQSNKVISGPTNGAVIQNAGAWGNKESWTAKPPESPKAREKEQKKRSKWGFREKPSSDGMTSHSNDSNSDLTRTQNEQSLNEERFATSERPGTTQSNTNVRAVFGIPLADAVDSFMAFGSDTCLPAVMYRCLEYLEAKEASNEEGIFRLSGSSVLIKALKERFNTEGDVDLLADGHYYDVHAVASLLKLYLRELPSTVLTPELHIEFLHVLKLEDKSSKIAAYNGLVHRLPIPNWHLLRALSAFLISIVNNSDLNKMSVRNITIVFSPTLNIPSPVFTAFLTDFDAIFGTEPATTTPIQVAAATPTLNADDIRSPRRQIFGDIPTPSYDQHTFARDGLGLTYDEILHSSHADPVTGFIPLQPSYDSHQPGSRSNKITRTASVTMPGPEYGAFQRTLGGHLSGGVKDTKARRRESSMLLMGNVGQAAQRKSSMPLLNSNSVREDSFE